MCSGSDFFPTSPKPPAVQTDREPVGLDETSNLALLQKEPPGATGGELNKSLAKPVSHKSILVAVYPKQSMGSNLIVLLPHHSPRLGLETGRNPAGRQALGNKRPIVLAAIINAFVLLDGCDGRRSPNDDAVDLLNRERFVHLPVVQV